MSLVLCLGLSTPTSSQAVLSQVIVGGAVAGQVAGLLTTTLPQITALVGSVAVVMKSGEEIGKTVRGIFELLVPGLRKPLPPVEAGEKKQKPAEKSSPGVEVVGREAQAQAKKQENPATRAPRLLVLPELRRASVEVRDGSADSERLETLEALLASYRHQQALQDQALGEDSGSAPDQEALLSVSRRYEGLVEAQVEELEEAGRRGDRQWIESLAQRAGELQASEQEAVRPVLESLVGRGRHFEALYEEGVEPGSFEALEDLYAELQNR